MNTSRRLSLCVLTLLACLPAASGARAEAVTTLRVAGSGSMAPLLRELGAAFAEGHPGFRLDVAARGSSTGPPLLLRGEADLASMSRPMTELELAAFQARFGRPPTAVAIAVDAVAVFVGAQNPIERLTLKQLDAIFSQQRLCGGPQPIRRWGDLGLAEPFAKRAIGIYVTPHASGTRGYFEMQALCDGRILDAAREQPGASSVVHAISESVYGIGYGSSTANAPDVKAVALTSDAGSSHLPSDTDAVRAGHYPLARALLLYQAPTPTPDATTDTPRSHEARSFLAFVLSDRGQEIVAEQGFLALEPRRAREELSRIE